MPIPLQPPAHVPDLATAIVRHAAAEPAARAAIYRDEVFPFAAARLLRNRHEQPRARLLVIPVGTQPFAPLLAALATPADHVGLLVTSESAAHAAEVLAALAHLPGADRPAAMTFPIGDTNSGIAVCKAVDAALFWAGDPWPSEVTLDVTGGRKATSAALGAIAGLRGFRQVYIESQQRDPGLFVDETLHTLDDVHGWLQDDERAAATALFAAGAFVAAAGHFERLPARVLAGPALDWMQAFCQAATAPEAERRVAFETLQAAVPPGPIRSALAGPAHRGEATAADAGEFLAALQQEGAWR
jgi:hypothetical protein